MIRVRLLAASLISVTLALGIAAVLLVEAGILHVWRKVRP